MNPGFINPRLGVEKCGVYKSGVEKFMVEKTGVEKYGVGKFMVFLKSRRPVSLKKNVARANQKMALKRKELKAQLKILQLELWLEPARLGPITTT